MTFGIFINCSYNFVIFSGWAPTRKLKDVIWGLNSLFSVSKKNTLHIYPVSKVFEHKYFPLFSHPSDSLNLGAQKNCLIKTVLLSTDTYVLVEK